MENDKCLVHNLKWSIGKIVKKIKKIRKNFSQGIIEIPGYSGKTVSLIYNNKDIWEKEVGIFDDAKNRAYVFKNLDFWAKYYILQNKVFVEKPSCALPILDVKRQPIIHLGDNYTHFSIAGIERDSITFRIKIGNEKFDISCKPSNYFGDVKAVRVQNDGTELAPIYKEIDKGSKYVYQFSYNVYANSKNRIAKKAIRKVCGMLREPSITIKPRRKVMTESDLINGNFDLDFAISVSKIQPEVHHKLPLQNIYKIWGLINSSIKHDGSSTQKSLIGNFNENMSKLLDGESLSVMGVDLGLRPLAIYAIREYTYNDKGTFPPGKMEKEILTGFLKCPEIVDMPFWTQSGYVRRPYSEFSILVNKFSDLVKIASDLNCKIRDYVDYETFENSYRKFAIDIDKVIVDIQKLDIFESSYSKYKHIFDSKDSLAIHLKNMPEDGSQWRKNKFLHPMKPFIHALKCIFQKLKYYQKNEFFLDNFKFLVAASDYFKIIKGYRRYGYDSDKILPDLDNYLNRNRKYTINLKKYMLTRLAKEIVRIAVANKVHFIALENLDLVKKSKNLNEDKNAKTRRDNEMFAIWAPGMIKSAIENCANFYGIKVGEVNPKLTSQIDSLTGEPGYRDSVNEKDHLYVERKNEYVKLNADVEAARNIANIFSNKHYFLPDIVVKMDDTKTVGFIPIPENSPRVRDNIVSFLGTHPVCIKTEDGRYVIKEDPAKYQSLCESARIEIRLRKFKNKWVTQEHLNEEMQKIRDNYSPQ